MRPTSWTATTRSTRDLAGAGVDGDLGDLAAERVHPEAVGVRAARAGAVDRRVAELVGHLDDVGVERAVAASGCARRDTTRSSGADLEDVGGELEQLPPHLPGGAAHRGHDGGRRHRAARDRAVEVRRRCRRRATRTRSSGSPSSSAATMRADVSVPVPMSWMPVDTSARPSASRRIDRVRGRPAAAPPDLRRAAHPAQEPVGAAARGAHRARPSRRARRRGRSRRAGACSSRAARIPGRRRRGSAGAARAGRGRARAASSSIACSSTVTPSTTPGRAERVLRAEARPDGERPSSRTFSQA